MSGSLTISISGTPVRLRSMAVFAVRVGKALVQALARVFFEVHAGDADFLFAAGSSSCPRPSFKSISMNPCSASGLSYCEIW